MSRKGKESVMGKGTEQGKGTGNGCGGRCGICKKGTGSRREGNQERVREGKHGNPIL
jgi:hypothetical protein